MKFRRDSDEETCDGTIVDTRGGREPIELACLRTKGHAGEHVAMMRDAAEADGVCAKCRSKLGAPHKTDCPRREITVDLYGMQETFRLDERVNCPYCTAAAVYVDTGPGDYYLGPKHVCVECSNAFTFNSESADERLEKIVEQIRAAVGMNR